MCSVCVTSAASAGSCEGGLAACFMQSQSAAYQSETLAGRSGNPCVSGGNRGFPANPGNPAPTLITLIISASGAMLRDLAPLQDVHLELITRLRLAPSLLRSHRMSSWTSDYSDWRNSQLTKLHPTEVAHTQSRQ